MQQNEKVTERNWSEYFEANLERRTPINWDNGVRLEEDRQEALIASMLRFQIGETGEGRHLKKCAATTGDEEYCRAIALFMAEENYHADMLARVLDALQVPLLKSHWTDAAFIVIRRFAGLKTELLVLMTAELIAKRYYRALHNSTADENVRLMCNQILRDEHAHVAFHCDMLSRAFASFPQWKRSLIRGAWKRFFQLVCRVVAWDHRGVLRAAKVSNLDWMRDTEVVFEQAARQIFTTNAVPQPVLDFGRLLER